MANISRYVDLAFCLVFLPLMIFIFPVERLWGIYPAFITSFVAWLYVTYFVYKYFVIPRLFHNGRGRIYALAVIAVSLAVTFLFSSYEITSPLHHLRMQHMARINYTLWGIRPNQQAVWLHYILVVIFCFALGMLDEAYRQRLARGTGVRKKQSRDSALQGADKSAFFLQYA